MKPFLEPQNVSPDMIVDEGENLKLTCNSTGIPMPNVIWSRLGGQLLSIGQEKYEVYIYLKLALYLIIFSNLTYSKNHLAGSNFASQQCASKR